MRRAAVLAVVLVMALSGVAQAAHSRPATVYGAYSYDLSVFGGDLRSAVIFAQGSDPVVGAFLRTRPSERSWFAGPVTCLSVDGSDAWIAGPITRTDAGRQDGATGALVRVHDGGRPGGKGDLAITFGDSYEIVLAQCQEMTRDGIDDSLLPIVAGNIVVQPAR
jgi:hypothetical protein